jgi:hypothetical protein
MAMFLPTNEAIVASRNPRSALPGATRGGEPFGIGTGGNVVGGTVGGGVVVGIVVGATVVEVVGAVVEVAGATVDGSVVDGSVAAGGVVGGAVEGDGTSPVDDGDAIEVVAGSNVEVVDAGDDVPSDTCALVVAHAESAIAAPRTRHVHLTPTPLTAGSSPDPRVRRGTSP